MKYLILISFIFLVALFSCERSSVNSRLLQASVDSLTKKLNDSYRPGLGEFMSAIQVHHAKLWFAAQNKNWPLANFEIKEIQESLEDIKHYCADRPEVKAISMINAPIDSISNAIDDKNETGFDSGYMLLTNTCNNCHKATGHGFNVIIVPVTPPFSNQNFKVRK